MRAFNGEKDGCFNCQWNQFCPMFNETELYGQMIPPPQAICNGKYWLGEEVQRCAICHEEIFLGPVCHSSCLSALVEQANKNTSTDI